MALQAAPQSRSTVDRKMLQQQYAEHHGEHQVHKLLPCQFLSILIGFVVVLFSCDSAVSASDCKECEQA